MKAKDFILIALILGIVAFFYFVDQDKKKQERDYYIDSLMSESVRLIKMDSIESAITKKILDSVNVVTSGYDKKLKDLEREAKQLRIKNNELEKKYNSIVIDRPEF